MSDRIKKKFIDPAIFDEIDGKIDAQKSRIDSILDLSTTDFDSFKEVYDAMIAIDTDNDSNLAAEIQNRISEDVATRISSGLNADGSYKTPDLGTVNYIGAADSLHKATLDLDYWMDSEFTLVKAGAGLYSNGAFPPVPQDANFIGSSTSLFSAIVDLDSNVASSISSLEGELEYKESDLAVSVFADEAPAQADRIKGWKYRKTSETQAVEGGRKINWYFLNDNADHDPIFPPSELGFQKNMTIGQLKAGQFSFSGIFEEMPDGEFFVQVYTKPRAGDTGWYHSKSTYYLNAKSDGIEGKRKLFYIENVPTSNPEELEMHEIAFGNHAYHNGTVTQDVLDTDEIKLVSLSTNSIAPVGVEMYVDRVILSVGSHSYDKRLTSTAHDSIDSILMSHSALEQMVHTEEMARISSDEAMKAGAGLESDGSVSFSGTNYIDSSASLRQASELLDAQMQGLENVVGDNKTNIEGQVLVERQRIDAILSSASADLDSFAEVVNYINQIDTQNDVAFNTFVTNLDLFVDNNTTPGQEGSWEKFVQDYLGGYDFVNDMPSDPTQGNLVGALLALKGLIDSVDSGQGANVSAVQAELDLTQQTLGIDADGDTASLAAASDDSNLFQGQTTMLDCLVELDAQVSSLFGDFETNLNNEIANRQQAVSDEEAARIAGDAALQSNLDTEEAARIAADSAEQTARIAADADLLSKIGQVRDNARKESFTGISTGQFVLGNHVIENTLTVVVGRVVAHEGVDYTVDYSTATVTFIGSMASGGDEEVTASDTIYVSYDKKVNL